MVIRSRTLPRATRRTVAALAAGVAFVSTLGAGAVDAAPVVRTAPELVTAAAAGALGADDAIACPIPSGSNFIDSWGASRSGGRGHKGVDMIADRGTPVAAAQSGDINFKRSRLGGNAAWLHSPNGNTFYYAHFDSFEGESRFVLQGEVIGYVGSTGNAQGPHLHFETHFDGSVGNPYSAAYAACVQPEIDALIALAEAEAEHAATHGEFKVTARTTAAETGDDVLAGTTIRR
jgi:murein DD-endopeptidase MepM/ murein hydrolase activator NlpD